MASARLWFLAAVAGQWIFVYYIVAFYGGSALSGDLANWGLVLDRGIVDNDFAGNLAIAMHVFLAAIILVGGPLQFFLGTILTGGGPLQNIQKVQTGARYFHHVNGRIYMAAVFITSLAGLYMLWIRGTDDGIITLAGLSLDAVLVILFAAIALRHAITGNIDAHRRWILRLFMVVSAVWFIRVGTMLWIVIHKGNPVGLDMETGTGLFVDIMIFAQYLVPLAILELYLYTKERTGAPARFAMAATLVVLTLAMSVGIMAAAQGMWLPAARL